MDYVSIPIREYNQLLKYRELIQILEDTLHEKEFNQKFIKEIEKAEENVKKGKCVRFKGRNEMRAYFERS